MKNALALDQKHGFRGEFFQGITTFSFKSPFYRHPSHQIARHQLTRRTTCNQCWCDRVTTKCSRLQKGLCPDQGNSFLSDTHNRKLLYYTIVTLLWICLSGSDILGKHAVWRSWSDTLWYGTLGVTTGKALFAWHSGMTFFGVVLARDCWKTFVVCHPWTDTLADFCSQQGHSRPARDEWRFSKTLTGYTFRSEYDTGETWHFSLVASRSTHLRWHLPIAPPYRRKTKCGCG